jgi:hypothetical protein
MQYLMLPDGKMLAIRAVQGSVQIALHGAEQMAIFPLESVPGAEFMSGNSPLVPYIFW